MTEDDGDRLLGNAVLLLLRAASDCWSQNELETARRLCVGAWRLLGGDTLIDAGPNGFSNGHA